MLPSIVYGPEGSFLCPMRAAAQDDTPCLAQEATISAQEVQILRLQLTNSAQELQLLQAQATSGVQEQLLDQMRLTVNAAPQRIAPIIVTVPVLVTATTLPSTATPSHPTPSITSTGAAPAHQELPSTAVNAQVQIVRVVGAGDITVEGIEIRNTGGVIDLTGWTLEDFEGNTFVFPEQRLFTNGLITIYTRRGTNTPISLYWGRSQPVWGEPGEIAILSDQRGIVQATYRVQ